MDLSDSLPTDSFWLQESLRFVRPEEFEVLGIDPADVPMGTRVALNHPSQIPSRYGGNAYGFGLVEGYDRLPPKEARLLQGLTTEDPADLLKHHRQLNRVYRKLGLLVRISSLGKPFYLIPVYWVSRTFTRIRARVEEMAGVIEFHCRKYLTEHQQVGVLCRRDDLTLHELSLRFKEHLFIPLDTLGRVAGCEDTLDLVILARDPLETLWMEGFCRVPARKLTGQRAGQYTQYLLWKIHGLLKPDGELFVIADHYVNPTSRTVQILFETEQELKHFALFTHIFRTRKRYELKGRELEVNLFDLQKYLRGLYLTPAELERLLQGRPVERIPLEEIAELPYLDFPLPEQPYPSDQARSWERAFSSCYDQVFLRPLVNPLVQEEWRSRFSSPGYEPHDLLVYLGQKKRVPVDIGGIRKQVAESRLRGCQPELLAEYRDSLEFVVRTLRVVERLKKGTYEGLPRVYFDRLRQPLENKNRRYPAFNTVLRLLARINRLDKLRGLLNPDRIEGPETPLICNLEALSLYGFRQDELSELLLISLGHTPMGRVLSGKLTEKTLKPFSDWARTLESRRAVNLLRFCRLMTLAETEAARGAPLTQEQVAELFDLYESAVRVVSNRDLDWKGLLDEKTSALGGLRNQVIRKTLKMINHFEFLDSWSELQHKGSREKEILAEYDQALAARIENAAALVRAIAEFEDRHLKSDPLQVPALYRKFLDMEFHGTGHLFERLGSRQVFVLLWITVLAARGTTINFNPILAKTEPDQTEAWVGKVEEEARTVNTRYLDPDFIRQLGAQVYDHGSAFIAGTGFQLRRHPGTQTLEIACLDMDDWLSSLQSLIRRITGRRLPAVPVADLRRLEKLFSGLESFHQSHLRLLHNPARPAHLPGRQQDWFERYDELRGQLRRLLLDVLFQPADIYGNLRLLYTHTPSVLGFLLPEFMSLAAIPIGGVGPAPAPASEHVIRCTQGLQALFSHTREDFQDIRFLHSLARREFGPLATGIVGLSENQLEELEEIVASLSANKELFRALTKSFVFQELGRLPELRDKPGSAFNPADYGAAAAHFITREGIAERYGITGREREYLLFLVRHHSLLHQIVKGEVSFSALSEILAQGSLELFDAFFLSAFIALSAVREGLILEDLASWLLQIRALCHGVLTGHLAFDSHLEETYCQLGSLFFALEAFLQHGLPEDVAPASYLVSDRWEALDRTERLRAGKMIFATERIFRLWGNHYVGFFDLASLAVKVPLKFIYKRRRFSDIGYSSFEKEIFEASRINSTLQGLPEEPRHFLLQQLYPDRVRILAFEKVRSYLNYENQIKLLLIGLLGAEKTEPGRHPVYLSYLDLSTRIKKRYEALNHFLNGLSVNHIWKNKPLLNHLFEARNGLSLRKSAFPGVITVDFRDRINMARKVTHMGRIQDVDPLKNYFHNALRSLKRYPFHTDDYEQELERAYEDRLGEMTGRILAEAGQRMNLAATFRELERLNTEFIERGWEIGFSADQLHRLNDLYELRKDRLRREKALEIEQRLAALEHPPELEAYWSQMRAYLKENRKFLGKEFEWSIARRFDEAGQRLDAAARPETGRRARAGAPAQSESSPK